MEATFDGDVVRAGERARERFYDARGYGRPDDGDLVLAPVEAAHLLFRGDLEAVRDGRAGASADDADGGRLDFRSFLATGAVSEVAFLVYADLRERGFYLAPADEPDGDGDDHDSGRGDPRGSGGGAAFEVYPRGAGPWDDEVAYRALVASEREDVPAERLRTAVGAGSSTGVLAVVDEESELTYLELSRPTLAGSTFPDLPSSVAGDLLADRVLVADPPDVLYERAFFGQRLEGADATLQLSLVEAAYLADQGILAVDGGRAAVTERGHAVEGDRFDRRLCAYGALRAAGLVPKTGFKFGADFRTYADVASVDDLGHSELLVRVLPGDHAFAPRDLALDVRLAGGVRKRVVYALVGDGIEWLSVERLTP